MTEFYENQRLRSEVRRLKSEYSSAMSTIDALKCERAELVEALRQFADVADHDIGESESDNDRFRPMFALNAAPPLLVGHLRRAATLLSHYGR